LARTLSDRVGVRAVTLRLVGDGTVSEYWVTRALQRLGDALAPDVGFLSGQNWALKSLAAILWSKTTQPSPVGIRLAADPDVRVRRALALHLREAQEAEVSVTTATEIGDERVAAREAAREEVLEALRRDPAFSVRRTALDAHLWRKDDDG